MALKLLHSDPYEEVNELENCLFQSFKRLQPQLGSLHHLSSIHSVETINQALLYGILTQPPSSQTYFIQLTAFATDGYACFMSILVRLIGESYPNLLDEPRTQLLWLLGKLVEVSAVDIESLCICLLRRIVGGNLSDKNIWLAAQMLDFLRGRWGWVSGCPGLLTIALFTYLRILPDHFMSKKPTLNELRQKEVSFCIQILRNCFCDCIAIGRDLVRLLQDVACIPEFEAIWRDLLMNPGVFNVPSFEDIAQLYGVRTPTRYLVSRLTPEMETQIRFILTHVKMGNQHRYQAWFSRFLMSPESESLVSDLIRFICCAHHPSNQILQSDIVPRWAIVGWLLKCCKSHHAEANAKLALLYDWLFFTTATDSIMNIEPALLLMVHSIPKYMDMTQSLLDFLFLLMDNYDPPRKDLIYHGVMSSIDTLVGKGVIRSLEPLSSCSLLAPWLRDRLASLVPDLCNVDTLGRGGVQGAPIAGQSIDTLLNHQKKAGLESLSQCGGGAKEDKKDYVDDQFTGKAGKAGKAGGAVVLNPVTNSIDRFKPDSSIAKRRRVETLTVDDLLKALAGSQEEALSVMEKMLTSFLSTPENLTWWKKGSVTKGPTDSTLDRLLRNSETFAAEVMGALKGAGYNLFTALSEDPATLSSSLMRDEMRSLTSVILRLYILWWNHPVMLSMLLFWWRKHLAVGPRLLCYACRLGENLEHLHANNMKASKQESAYNIEAVSEGGDHNGTTVLMPKGASSDKELAMLSWHTSSIGATEETFPIFSKEMILAYDNNIWDCCSRAVSDTFCAYVQLLEHVKNDYASSDDDMNLKKRQASNGFEKTLEGEEYIRGEELESLLLADLETCLAWSVERLLWVFPWVFKHLQKLSVGNQKVIELLVSVLNPVQLVKLEYRLTLKEIAVMGTSPNCVAKLIRTSLQWDCFEQQYFWRLLIAELQSCPSQFAVNLLEGCILSINPSQHFEAMSGFLLYLKLLRPTGSLAFTLVFLPSEFGKFSAAALASWAFSDITIFLQILEELAEPKEREEDLIRKKWNTVAVSDLIEVLVEFFLNSNDVDEKVKDRISRVKCRLLELAGISNGRDMEKI